MWLDDDDDDDEEEDDDDDEEEGRKNAKMNDKYENWKAQMGIEVIIICKESTRQRLNVSPTLRNRLLSGLKKWENPSKGLSIDIILY